MQEVKRGEMEKKEGLKQKVCGGGGKGQGGRLYGAGCRQGGKVVGWVAVCAGAR